MDPLSLLSVGSSVVGGIAGLFGSSKAEKRAAEAASEALALQREALGFSMQQYQDWKNTYGVIEKQLSDYYVNSDGQMQRDTAANIIEKAFRDMPMQIERTAAQRGLGEEQKAAMTHDMLMGKAESKASARIAAGEQFRAEKQGFLGSSLNARAQATSGVTNGYNAMAQLLSGQAASYKQDAANAATSGGSAISSGLKAFMALNGGGSSAIGTGSVSTADYDIGQAVSKYPSIFG